MVKPLINRFLKSSEGTWVQPPASSEYIQQLKLFMNSDIGFKILIGALAIGIIITIFFKKNNILWRETIVIFLWWFIPFSIMFLVSQKIPMFTNRYILFNTIGFYLFIGAAITTLYKNIRFLIPIIGITLLVVMFLKLKTQNLAVRETQKSANFIQSKINKNSSIIILPQWANLGFMYYFDRDIFMDHENYNSLLNKNKIFPAWGFQDAQRNIQKHCPGRIIYYQNNSKSVDPTNSILNYLDSAYIRTDSAYFQKGISVTIFEKSVLDSTNNYFN
jgi:hypothetical protein